MRTRDIIGVVIGAVLTAGTVAVPAAGASGPAAPAVLRPDRDTRVQQTALALVNQARRRHGCAPVRLDDRLIRAASRHAADMAWRGYFAHRSPDGDGVAQRVREAGYDWRYYAENIARGQDSPAEVVDGWLHSASHRRNILDCDLREVGVGLAFDADRTPYWVQDLATHD